MYLCSIHGFLYCIQFDFGTHCFRVGEDNDICPQSSDRNHLTTENLRFLFLIEVLFKFSRHANHQISRDIAFKQIIN